MISESYQAYEELRDQYLRQQKYPKGDSGF